MFFLWGSLVSCAPVVNRRSRRVNNPPQAASLPHTEELVQAVIELGPMTVLWKFCTRAPPYRGGAKRLTTHGSRQSFATHLLETVRIAELHWFEAHGIGREKMRIKRFLD